MNRRTTGTAYEKIAADYLRKQGVWIREVNYQISQGEIDIIGEDRENIIFIEVKYRKTASYGQPWEAVSKHKQKKIPMESSVGIFLLYSCQNMWYNNNTFYNNRGSECLCWKDYLS